MCQPGHDRDKCKNSGTVPVIPGHLTTMEVVQAQLGLHCGHLCKGHVAWFDLLAVVVPDHVEVVVDVCVQVSDFVGEAALSVYA